MELYGCRSTGGGYRVVKFDQDFNIVSIWNLHGNVGLHLNCDCPSGRWSNICKHQTIVLLFERVNRVNKGFFLDYEANKWHLPLTFRRRGHDRE